jgi:amino acid permease
MKHDTLRLYLQDAQVFFITIAVLLGTGILGLPVKLTDCGYWPFFTVFTLTIFMQMAIIFVTCDLVEIAKQSLPRSDLHTIGRRYLTTFQSLVFDVAVLVTFVSTLISYALAGSKAFVTLAQVFDPSLNPDSSAVITPFTWSCTFAIIFLEALIKPVIAIGTGAKVLLLIFIIAIVGMVANVVGVQASTDWADLMQPYLVGTVAIGGIGNLLPSFYDSYLVKPPAPGSGVVPASPAYYERARKHFRLSVCGGVIMCYGLNLAWAAFVLGIVPQTEADAAAMGFAPSESLQDTAANGDPATVPVTHIIDQRYPRYQWVATTVSVFIALSILVSYNAVGLGLKHVLDGMAVSGFRAAARRLRLSAEAVQGAIRFWGGGEHAGAHKQHQHRAGVGAAAGLLTADEASPQGAAGASAGWLSCVGCRRACSQLRSNPAARAMVVSRGLFYAAVFGLVWGIAISNPQGFITVLEVFTSMALNASGGVFICVMYLTATLPKALGGCGAPRVAAAPDYGAIAASVTTPSAGTAAPLGATAASGEWSLSGVAGALTDSAAEEAGSRSVAAHVAPDADAAADEEEEEAETLLLRLPPLAQQPLGPRVLGLGGRVGRLLTNFALLTFMVAVLYDAYTAVADRATTTAAAFALLAGVAALWSLGLRPFVLNLLWADACIASVAEACGLARSDESETGPLVKPLGSNSAAGRQRGSSSGAALSSALLPGLTAGSAVSRATAPSDSGVSLVEGAGSRAELASPLEGPTASAGAGVQATPSLRHRNGSGSGAGIASEGAGAGLPGGNLGLLARTRQYLRSASAPQGVLAPFLAAIAVALLHLDASAPVSYVAVAGGAANFAVYFALSAGSGTRQPYQRGSRCALLAVAAGAVVAAGGAAAVAVGGAMRRSALGGVLAALMLIFAAATADAAWGLAKHASDDKAARSVPRPHG